MAIILQEAQRAVFYAPYYAALALNSYRDQGVDVSFRESSRPDNAVKNVTEGSSDLSWGGPMRVIVAHDRNPQSDLFCFSEVVTRDPFMLIAGVPCAEFKLADLFALRLAVVSEVPTPWCCLQDDFRRAGLDPVGLNVNARRTMSENAAALRAGEVDVVQFFEPYAQELIDEGVGHLWYSAASRGQTSYTCFYARRSVLDKRRTEFVQMTCAIARTQEWLHSVSPLEISRVVKPYFPHLDSTRLTAAITNYWSSGIWGETPHLPQAGYEQLRRSLLSSGLVKRAPAFEQVVDNTFADAVTSYSTASRGTVP
jgi:NitT/TauT family transport system substrate-binding protein